MADVTVFAVAATDLIYRMYDRTVKPVPPRPTTGLRYRVETLIGLTGVKMAKYRTSWPAAIGGCVDLVWRPHLIGILLFEVSNMKTLRLESTF